MKDFKVDAPRKPVVWQDLSTGKYHAVNNETGEEVQTDADGRPIAQFHHNVSGVATTKQRLSLRLKDVALQKSLLGPEPKRPDALLDRQFALQLKEDRVETKGRFRSKLLPEAELFLRQQADLRQRYPSIVAAAAEEEAKAKHKIEELHKNYYALQASNDAGTKTVQTKKEKDVRNVSKSVYYSFTSTGVFRP